MVLAALHYEKALAGPVELDNPLDELDNPVDLGQANACAGHHDMAEAGSGIPDRVCLYNHMGCVSVLAVAVSLLHRARPPT